jgi:hypothetical protein
MRHEAREDDLVLARRLKRAFEFGAGKGIGQRFLDHCFAGMRRSLRRNRKARRIRPEGATRLALVLDVNDGRAQLAGARQQAADLGQSSPDAHERQLAVNIFPLRVDHDQDGVRQSGGSDARAGHLQEGFGSHGDVPQCRLPRATQHLATRYKNKHRRGGSPVSVF